MQDTKSKHPETIRSVAGCINGIFLYDLIWPLIVVTIMQLVLGNNYHTYVDNHYYLMSLILMIITSIITLSVSLFIAQPKLLISEYKSMNNEKIKFALKCLGVMILANFVYNFILISFGVDISGGNANQNAVVELMNANPILAFITMVICAPLLEEVTYRYFLYGGIAKYSRKWAIIVSGFIFMCVHAIPSFTEENVNIVRELLLLPPYMFSGMVLAYAYDKTENLSTSTVVHALNNLISFIISFI